MNKKVVIFFGADGTGKTTQATLLLKRLGQEGLNASKIWIRGRHSLASCISALLLRLGYKGYITVPESLGGKILDTRRIRGKWIWSFIEFLSVIPLIITKMYGPLYLGRSIIAERYVIDTIVYNGYFLGSTFDGYARVLLHMIPKGAFLIHLDAFKEDILSRRAEDLISEAFIEYQLENYRKIAARAHALSINTSIEGIEQVSKNISSFVYG
jgi:thymidylate kinase